MKSNDSIDGGHPLLLGLRAARANLIPGLIVQAAMMALVGAYYFSEPARQILAHLAEAKLRMGYLFSFCAGVVAGGFLPELMTVAVFQKWRVRKENWRSLLFAVCFWGVSAMIVDGFYRLQATVFGVHVDWATILKKVIVDQFVYNPVWAAPWGIAAFEWKNQGYRWDGMTRVFGARLYREKTLPALVATWGVWIPVVGLIYALPSLLQIPLFSLALTFWVMIFTWMNGNGDEPARERQ